MLSLFSVVNEAASWLVFDNMWALSHLYFVHRHIPALVSCSTVFYRSPFPLEPALLGSIVRLCPNDPSLFGVRIRGRTQKIPDTN